MASSTLSSCAIHSRGCHRTHARWRALRPASATPTHPHASSAQLKSDLHPAQVRWGILKPSTCANYMALRALLPSVYDNYHIRTLLGRDVWELPLGGVNMSHLQAANEVFYCRAPPLHPPNPIAAKPASFRCHLASLHHAPLSQLLARFDAVILASAPDRGKHIALLLGMTREMEQARVATSSMAFSKVAQRKSQPDACSLSGPDLIAAAEDNQYDVALYETARKLQQRQPTCAWPSCDLAVTSPPFLPGREKLLQPGAARRWLDRARIGICFPTPYNSGCKSGKALGSWTQHQAQAANWTVLVQSCLEQCAMCKECAYISASVKHRECNWFATCNYTNGVMHRQTALVKQPSEGRRAMWLTAPAFASQ